MDDTTGSLFKMTGVLLIQLGTPDSPSVSDVRKYLSEFLNDPRVIDIPWLLRRILVNLIIVPFRAPKSAKIYRMLWTDKGSPLLFYSESLKQKLQTALGDDFEVELAMRYKNPSMNSVLDRMRKKVYTKIIILPLFPQYASASTGSAVDKALEIIRGWWVIPELKVINQFFNNEVYINAVVEIGKKYNHADFDHILFSYHGLPVRHVDKVYNDSKPCNNHNCENEINESNQFCYKAACYATTRLLAERLNIPKEKYTVCFQSRLNKKWLEPFTDKIIIEKAKTGTKKLLVFSPAFVADCLETIVEIGHDYELLFRDNGGEQLQLVESLNDTPLWVEAVKNIVLH
jgi:ferrochelatase